jgi:integrase
LLPDFDNKKKRYLTRMEADALLDELKRHSKDVHDMTLLSLNAGLRAGEIFSLTWGCVDIERGRLTLLDTKNRETRTAFLNDTAKAMLSSRNRGKHDELVFPNSRGGKILQISDTFNNAVLKIGLNDNVTDRRLKVTFHTCRHSAASWMVDNGTPLYFVKEILGHKHISTTERYSHNAESSLEAAVNALGTMKTTTGAEVIPMTAKK